MSFSHVVDEGRGEKLPEKLSITQIDAETAEDGEINASGHIQEVDRNFSLLSICSMGVTTGSVWPALGGSIAVAINNGGSPGVIWEFVVVSIFYWFVSASIAELASSIPSSAGVYHWASVGAGPRWGKIVGFFAGYWNCLAWILGTASISSIAGQIIVSMWALFHDDYVFQRLAAFSIVAGAIVTIIICTVMPTTQGSGYATNDFVWKDWVNFSGYPNGFAFLTGMLNGAYAVGTPDVTSHLAEEIPKPSRNIPKALLSQNFFGFITGFPYLIAILYAITDMDAVLTSKVPFPLGAVYLQATTSPAAACGLLAVILLPICCIVIGGYITCGRMLWTLARDDATPFSGFLGKINPRFKNQLNATLCCGVIVTAYGAIYVGSLTAFNAFVGSFIILSTLSYTSAILPNLIARGKHIRPGPFNLGMVGGRIVAAISCTYMIVFMVIYCFPFYLPTDVESMNYTSLITGGSTVLFALWYVWKRNQGYEGPVILRYHE